MTVNYFSNGATQAALAASTSPANKPPKAFAEKAKGAGATVVTFVAKDRDHMGVVRILLEDKSPVLEQVLSFLKKPKGDAK